MAGDLRVIIRIEDIPDGAERSGRTGELRDFAVRHRLPFRDAADDGEDFLFENSHIAMIARTK